MIKNVNHFKIGKNYSKKCVFHTVLRSDVEAKEADFFDESQLHWVVADSQNLLQSILEDTTKLVRSEVARGLGKYIGLKKAAVKFAKILGTECPCTHASWTNNTSNGFRPGTPGVQYRRKRGHHCRKNKRKFREDWICVLPTFAQRTEREASSAPGSVVVSQAESTRKVTLS